MANISTAKVSSKNIENSKYGRNVASLKLFRLAIVLSIKGIRYM
ncbi:hypothetical protein [Pedobacter sp. MR2016-19]|nr:hypothetical protein [Pedobacter sp. MR2016-19]